MDDSPDRIGPDEKPKRNFSDKSRSIIRALTTKEGLIGDYDYAFLFKPTIPFMTHSKKAAPFFGLDDHMPVLLALLLGFQHALAMLDGITTPLLVIASEGAAGLGADDTQYLVSTALIMSGLLSSIQITRFHVFKTPYYIGTGLISVVGTSFAIIPVTKGAFSQMYATGFCPTGADGTKLPCPQGYGALLGTACLCSLLEIGLSFTKPSVLKRIFPPLVTGPTVMLIGVSLIQSGFQDWAGGSATPGCITRPTSGPYTVCPQVGAPHALPWGSAEYIGLGFSVFVTIVIAECFGSPIMKSGAAVLGLLVGCIFSGAFGYLSPDTINAAPAASFVWVKTFPLSIYPPIILPLMAVYVVLVMEAIGDISATCDVSHLEVEGQLFDSRIQGGVLADGFNGLIAGLCTITPMSTFAQNNGVIALTRCANRKAGYAACFFLFIMGVFSKFAAALISIPSPVLGGLTTFLFSSVTVSGVRIISTMPFTRRNRFILVASMSLGFGATMVPNWFSYVFTYSGDNQAKQGFFNALILVLETGFAVTGFMAIFLNLVLSEEEEDEPTGPTADLADEPDDEAEWGRIRRNRRRLSTALVKVTTRTIEGGKSMTTRTIEGGKGMLMGGRKGSRMEDVSEEFGE